MSIEYPISDIEQVQILRLWGKYDIPVFSVSQIPDLASLTEFFEGSDSYDYGPFGTQMKIVEQYFKNTMYMPIIEDAYSAATGAPGGTIQEISEIETEEYTDGKTITFDIQNYVSGGSSVATRRVIPESGFNSLFLNVYENGEFTSLMFGNGAGSVFIKVTEAGVDYYCRVGVLETGSESNGYFLRLSNSDTPVDRGEDFFGPGYTPLTIDQIANGNAENVDITNDPFGPGGTSGQGGGGGDFDGTSVPIDIPPLPAISASNSGFITLFNPSLSQLRELSEYMWSDLYDINGWKKLFADPMDAILGLSILPVTIPPGGTQEVKVGNISTGIEMTVAYDQFVELDCGSIDVNEYWGAYLDYEPYTHAQIYLPYIGTHPISVDDIMGKTVRVVYHVDIMTGACCCFIKCGDSVLYTFNGQCSIPVPVTSSDYTSVINGLISIAASAATLVATGGATAPMIAAGAAAGATKTAVAQGRHAQNTRNMADISEGTNIASNAVNQMKPQIAKSGPLSGGGGMLSGQTPYLILTRPRQALPKDQNAFMGYPSLVTVQLAELSGYTEVSSIHLENIPATSSELSEIEGLLKGGVIL